MHVTCLLLCLNLNLINSDCSTGYGERESLNMDWSSHFEDEGLELGEWDAKWTSRVSFLSSFSSSLYTPFVAYLFTINYILGVGALGMPHAFYASGIIVGVIFTFVCSFMSYLTTVWVAHAAFRVKQGQELAKGNPFRSPKQLKKKKISQKRENDETAPLAEESKVMRIYRSLSGVWGDEETVTPITSPAISPTTSPSRRRQRGVPSSTYAKEDPEVVDVVEELLGSRMKVLYQVSLLALTVTGLVAYTQVFVRSFLSQVQAACPLWAPTLLFGLIVVPLSCLDLNEQVQTQIVMSMLRFVCLALIFLGMLVAIWMHDGGSVQSKTLAYDHSGAEMPLVKEAGAGVMFSTAVFSQLFQHSVPGLIRPLASEKKRHVPNIFFSALMTTAFIYCFISIACCYHLGSDIQQSINLNFVGFTWGSHKNSVLRPLSSGLSLLVVLFPAFDTLSVYPLIAITLGNSLMRISPDLMRPLASGWTAGGDEESTKAVLSVLWRLVASLFPLAFSLFVEDLSLSLMVGGICGIIVAFITPAALQLEARERVSRTPPIFHPCPYETPLTKVNVLVHVVLIFSAGALALCITQTINALLS